MAYISILLPFLIQSATSSNLSTGWNLFKPIMAQLGFGGILGWAVGLLFKKTIKFVAIIIAIIFIGIQYCIYKGYIQGVDWLKISGEFKETFNEGFFTGVWGFVTQNLPFGGGFTVGFLIGLKMG